MKVFFTPRVYVFASLLMLLSLLSAHAQQTKKISLQGFLKDANGKAVADGQQAITFKLYTQDAGGTAEWTEDQTVNVFGGVYSTHLGKTVPLENLNWGASTYYVGVTVQGTELTPRTELTFAPYSLGSPFAQVARTVTCSGAVGDIKHSILNPTQFAAKNGSCWVPMDGRSIVGSELAATTGMTNVPNGGGLFIRSQEFSNSDNDPDRSFGSAIAQFQEQGFLSHNHSYSLKAAGNTSVNGLHSHRTALNQRGFDTDNSDADGLTPDNSGNTYGSDAQGNHYHTFDVSVTGSIDNNGNNETRPKNMNFWVYIRIN